MKKKLLKASMVECSDFLKSLQLNPIECRIRSILLTSRMRTLHPDRIFNRFCSDNIVQVVCGWWIEWYVVDDSNQDLKNESSCFIESLCPAVFSGVKSIPEKSSRSLTWLIEVVEEQTSGAKTHQHDHDRH